MIDVSHVTSWANDLGADVIRAVPALTAWTGVLLLAAWALDHLLRRRVAAHWRLLLYVAVLGRLVLPAGWQSPLGLVGTPTRVEATRVAAATIAMPADSPAPAVVSAPTAPPRVVLSWRGAAGLAWLLGVAAVLATAGVQRLRLARALRSAAPATPPDGLEWPRSLRLVAHPEVGPAVVGILRPRVVVPRRVWDGVDSAALRDILRHEAAHVTRRDPWLALAVQVLVALAWPILPAWLAARRLRALMEEACDEAALVGADEAGRRSYATTLAEVATLAAPRRALALGLLPFGSALASRLRALRFTRRWPAAAQAALTLALVASLLALAGSRATHAGDAPSPAPADVDAAPIEVAVVAYPRLPLAEAAALGWTPPDLPLIEGDDQRIVTTSDWRAAIRATDAWSSHLGKTAPGDRRPLEASAHLGPGAMQPLPFGWLSRSTSDSVDLELTRKAAEVDGRLLLSVRATTANRGESSPVSSSILVGVRKGETAGLLVPGGVGSDAYVHVVTVTWPLASASPVGDRTLEERVRDLAEGLVTINFVKRSEGDSPSPRFVARGRVPTPGDPLTMSAFMKRLEEAEGLRGAEIAMLRRQGDGIPFTVTVIADVIAEIRVEGNERLGADEIRARFPIAPGDIYTERAVQAAYRELWRTGLFADLRVSHGARGEAGRRLVLTVREVTPGEPAPDLEPPARIAEVEGDVRIKRAAEASWQPAHVGDLFQHGDRLTVVAPGSARVVHPSGETQDFGPDTIVECRATRDGNTVTEVDEVDEAEDDDEEPTMSVDLQRRADGTMRIDAVEVASLQRTLEHASGEEALAAVRELLSAHGNAVLDRRQGAILVEDKPDTIARVEARLDALDVPPAPPAAMQDVAAVMVEYRIFEADETVLQSLGFAEGALRAASSAETSVTRTTDDTLALDLLLQQAADQGRARIVSAPRVLVQVGQRAEVESSSVQFPGTALRITSHPIERNGSVVVDSTLEIDGRSHPLATVTVDGSTALSLAGPAPDPSRTLVVAVTASPSQP